MYAKVVTGGKLAEGDAVEVVDDADMTWIEAATENASDYALWPRIAKVTACEAGETSTRFRLETATPWALPSAQGGQRLRLHLGPGQWASHYLTSTSPDHYELEVQDSKTGDPVTAILRKGIPVGQTVLISGPFGKVKK